MLLFTWRGVKNLIIDHFRPTLSVSGNSNQTYFDPYCPTPSTIRQTSKLPIAWRGVKYGINKNIKQYLKLECNNRRVVGQKRGEEKIKNLQESICYLIEETFLAWVKKLKKHQVSLIIRIL
jgi:hypothetical protein